jgi:(5-formylfuran-3-yl)methyl phosphate synthase
MARLLVSVRSEVEARAALAGGAAIIDVKEPSRGSLGMASTSVWAAVRRAVPTSMIVSVALGELINWIAPRRRTIEERCWDGIDFRKLGLAHAGPSWRDQWRELRARINGESSARPGGAPLWVAVAYLDWEAARAPDPESVIGEAAAIGDCLGVLFDTWDKSRRIDFDLRAARWIVQAKEVGRFVALAGSLDEPAIRRLRPLKPDIFAVRGAACRGGDRNAPIDRDRVARLVDAVSSGG